MLQQSVDRGEAGEAGELPSSLIPFNAGQPLPLTSGMELIINTSFTLPLIYLSEPLF